MTPPSSEIESNDVEQSSSSGGSFVHSMNRLSTAKGCSADSPDTSDMSGQMSKTSEVSEESDPDESAKDAPDESSSSPKSDSKELQKEQESAAVTTTGKDTSLSVAQQDIPKGEVFVADIASTLTSHDSDAKSVEALALIAVEAGAKHSPIEDAVIQLSNAASSQAPADNPLAAAAQLNSASSDQSVGHTVESSLSGNSSRSNNAASFVPTNADASKTAASGAPAAPMGHIHLKAKKPVAKKGSLPQLVRPTPIASMPAMPVASTAPSTKSKSSSLRRGKWTVEEEAYVARVIQDFNSGFLNAPAGTTLRSYLSEKLHCDPMRITKKFTGDACIGKRVFHPAVRCASNAAAIDKAQTELDALERRWRRRLEMQQRESAKKAAASAAAAVAAATGRPHLHAHVPPPQVGASSGAMSNPRPQAVPSHPGTAHQINQTAVARTATWLDRANAILSTKNDGTQAIPMHTAPSIPTPAHSQPVGGVGSLPQQEIENQMKEVQRLIHEGPIIQQTTAGLPHLLDHGQPSSISGQRKVTEDGQHYSYASSPPEPADKRARTSSASDSSGAEDAEALVGFLNSVRASAEASGNGFAAP